MERGWLPTILVESPAVEVICYATKLLYFSYLVDDN